MEFHVAARTVALVLMGTAMLQAGCSSVAIAPPYSQQELKAECERRRGMWHPNDLTGGFCEYRAARSTNENTPRQAEPRSPPM